MSVQCNACGSAIQPQDINVQADTALCRACGTATPYSALVHAPTASMYTAPPSGCHVEDLGNRWRAVASTRSWQAIPTAGFAIVWNGFLCVFLGAILLSPRGKGPPWFVAFFLSGHMAAGIWVAWTALCMSIGDVEAVIENDTLSVGTGIGPVRLRRRRLLSEIRSVRTDQVASRRGQWGRIIFVEGPRPLKFGRLLSDERRQFMHAVLASELLRRQRAAPPRAPALPVH